MKRFKILVCMVLAFLSLSAFPKEKEVEYKLNKEVGEIAPGVYEIAPEIYEIGTFGQGWDDRERKKVLNKEILSDVLKFRDSYLTGDLDTFLDYYSKEYYDDLIWKYKFKKTKKRIKSLKEIHEAYKNDILDCMEPKDYRYELCEFWKDRENAIKNRVRVIVRTYDSTNPKFKIGGMAIAFVELDGNNPNHPYSKEFQFVREKGKLRIVATVFPDRPDIEFCVFCYYESGEEAVREMFNSIKQANELK
ncbi:hypothetical protein QMM42_17755 [Leptospira santarosai]|uniref:hypothetical protein n=1 Tax=Leptospira santarosai TaxID=28183 RepID=UPI0007738F22|nr:hypothetical protein [Leptospira santarosai]MDI7167022.1 hypothetical protein [Leptospira santarosai]MDI7188016.1 hypothetical protein [Leptospira santarosai]MDI7201778.1 hypothetical protein [Leptospira santarosai]